MFHPHLGALGGIWVDKEFPSDGFVPVGGVSCLGRCGGDTAALLAAGMVCSWSRLAFPTLNSALEL